MKLLIASRNRHKIEEIRAIFSDSAPELLSIDDFDDLPEVEEDGTTFESNAVKKAVTLALETNVWALADDSGLEVDALSGAPGVYSARYAGAPPDYAANNEKLLRELDGCNSRNARFVCVIALSSPSGKAQTVEGVCRGSIGRVLKGSNGFGYDPLFVPEGFDETFAELSSETKNAISHRGRAIDLAARKWGCMLAANPTDWPTRF